MGVPKFYRWISERYPKINQIISDLMLMPEFDNLYLDMNGIIHACSHPNDEDVCKAALSEREMMLGMFNYVDRIVTQIIKPKKILFMAVDGVAPRAKLNQQRSRRFRAAKDRLDLTKEARERGEIVDESAAFDSNAITPGTEFMAKVSEHLKWFVRKKMKEDPVWQRVTVLFSGHEVPGEGEHKIMQYIREQRELGALGADTTHCMYGNDADLIMLGLVTHEPHFTLLREVIDFNANRKDGPRGGGAAAEAQRSMRQVIKQSRSSDFQLLHVSLLREYLQLEFCCTPDGQPLAWDHERVVDDFVFITFLVGNDFLPHLPSLDIGEHAFDRLFDLYKRMLPTWGEGGYLTDGGEIADPDRLQAYLAQIGAMENDIFSERVKEQAEFNARRRRYDARDKRPASVPSELELETTESAAEATFQQAIAAAVAAGEASASALRRPPGKDWSNRYYFEKLHLTPGTAQHTKTLGHVVRTYVEGLAWCLAYYYKGCIDWGWYYPYHYGPLVADVAGGAAVASLGGLRGVLEDAYKGFELGKPFQPFEQLMGALPSASAKLLPRPYRRLMNAAGTGAVEASPIGDYYPTDFAVDMNGKRNPWEGVNILPFIDEHRLRDALRQFCPPELLTAGERQRNSFGVVYEFRYDPTNQNMVQSCNPDIGLPDIRQCATACIGRDDQNTYDERSTGFCLRAALPKGVKIPFPGFPSLHVLPFASVAHRKIGLNVFGSESRYDTLTLTLMPLSNLPPPEKLAASIVGRSVFVNWPMMHEARIVAISDGVREYRRAEAPDGAAKGNGGKGRKADAATTAVGGGAIVTRELLSGEQEAWKVATVLLHTTYFKGNGTPGSGGVDIGEIPVKLAVAPLQGMRSDPATGALTKVWGREEAEVPLHLALWQSPAADPRFVERAGLTVAERLPAGMQVIIASPELAARSEPALGPEHLGCVGRIVGAPDADGGVRVALDTWPAEPPFGRAIASAVGDKYVTAAQAAAALRLRPDLFGKICGSLKVQHGGRFEEYDLGLRFKIQHGQFCLLGYCRIAEKPADAAGAGATAAWSTGGDSVRIVGSESATEAQARSAAEAVSEARWEYSPRAVRVVAEYLSKFPNLFAALKRDPHARSYRADGLFSGNTDSELADVCTWLAGLPTASAPRAPVTTRSLSEEAVRAVQRAADVRAAKLGALAAVPLEVARVPTAAVYAPPQPGAVVEAPAAGGIGAPTLGDRVLNLCAVGVPFALRGTLVAAHHHSGQVGGAPPPVLSPARVELNILRLSITPLALALGRGRVRRRVHRRHVAPGLVR